jgi:argininosuccinate lyase
MPQRTAHGVVGKLVRQAMDRGVRLADLSLEEFKAIDASLDACVYEVLGAERAVAAFVSYGSTAPDQVAQQLKNWKQKLNSGGDG